MLLPLLLAALPQDAVFPGGPDDPPPARSARDCASSDPEEVTICARDPAAFRTRRLDNPYREKPIRARATLPGGKVAEAEAVQRGIAPGISVPSLMFNLRVPLGKKKKQPDPAQ